MPLGFKNGTNGSLVAAVNAIKAATQPQTFLGVSPQGIASAVTTKGNPYCHIILRGGENGPNYDHDHVATSETLLEEAGLRPAIMIDASHDNSGKDHTRQPAVFRSIIAQRVAGDKNVIGSMLESNLRAGSQKFPQAKQDLLPGVSITDACIDWETTEALVREAAAKLPASGA